MITQKTIIKQVLSYGIPSTFLFLDLEILEEPQSTDCRQKQVNYMAKLNSATLGL